MEAQLIDVKADIRERLLHVAVRLFAEKGIDAVSMRTINTEAGSKNKSAVHYHFGSKIGIVEAIFDMFSERISPTMNDLLQRIEKRSEEENVSIAEILLTFYYPFFKINRSEGYGPYVIKLFAKMMLDTTPEYQHLFNNYFDQHLKRVYVLMQKQLPEKSDQDLRFQLIHSLMATVAGIATIDLMGNTPLGDIRFDDDLQMALSYVDYMTGGLANEASCLEQIDIKFWQDYLQE